jgi:hypothetical protein
MTITTTADWAIFLLSSGGMGMTGQLVRAIAGTKKINDKATGMEVKFADVFDWPKFLMSLTTGFVAGVIAGLSLNPDGGSNSTNSHFWLGVLAAGYAGADFIEAFLKKSLPDVQELERGTKKRVVLQ